MSYSPVYDMLIRIKNGQLARKTCVHLPENKLCSQVLPILHQKGYIFGFSSKGRVTVIRLQYSSNRPVMKNLSLFAKNSIFLSLKQLWKIDTEFKLLILSTTKGFLTGKVSKENKLGGRLICTIE